MIVYGLSSPTPPRPITRAGGQPAEQPERGAPAHGVDGGRAVAPRDGSATRVRRPVGQAGARAGARGAAAGRHRRRCAPHQGGRPCGGARDYACDAGRAGKPGGGVTGAGARAARRGGRAAAAAAGTGRLDARQQP
eukprot:358615-Chlamydomonas_euryale.AAC.1